MKKKYNNIQFCKYNCPEFIDGDLHKGIFGMFTRFLPYFDPSLKSTIRMAVDIDYDDREVQLYFDKIPSLMVDGVKALTLTKIGYEWKYANFFKSDVIDGTCLANLCIRDVVIPYKIFHEALHEMNEEIEHKVQLARAIGSQIENNTRKRSLNKIEKMMHDMIIARQRLGSDENKFGENITAFTYGVDEWFINMRVLKTLDDMGVKVYQNYASDNLGIYAKQMINWKRSDRIASSRFLQHMLGRRYTGRFHKDVKMYVRMFSSHGNYRTIDNYKRYISNIKKLYNYVKHIDIKSHNNIYITGKDWVDNLKKHVDAGTVFSFEFFRDSVPDEVFDYGLDNLTPVKN
jgi:hypothetical protein